MPQMAPMSWLMMFMFFLIIAMMVATMNYFSYKPKIKTTKAIPQKNLKLMSWKW